MSPVRSSGVRAEGQSLLWMVWTMSTGTTPAAMACLGNCLAPMNCQREFFSSSVAELSRLFDAHAMTTTIRATRHCQSPATPSAAGFNSQDLPSRAVYSKSVGLETHHRIVDLSDGHPLALSYLLNRLRDAGREDWPRIYSQNCLHTRATLKPNILTVWDEVKDDSDIVDILAICSRLRSRLQN